MSKSTVIFVFLTIVYTATALECYHCTEKTCKDPESTWPHVPCQGANQACVKHVYKDSRNEQQTVRKCIIKDAKLNPCNEKLGTEITCDVCTSDMCNSATAVYGQFAIVLSVLAFLIPKVLMH